MLTSNYLKYQEQESFDDINEFIEWFKKYDFNDILMKYNETIKNCDHPSEFDIICEILSEDSNHIWDADIEYSDERPYFLVKRYSLTIWVTQNTYQ